MTILQVPFPVFSCASDNKSIVVIGGGGGGKHFGVRNLLQCYYVNKNQIYRLSELDTGSEVPISLEYFGGFWTCCFEKSAIVIRVNPRDFCKIEVSARLSNAEGFRFLKFVEESEGSRFFLSGTNSGKLNFWSVSATPQIHRSIDTSNGGKSDAVVDACCIAGMALVGNRSGTIRIYNVSSGQQIRVIESLSSLMLRRLRVWKGDSDFTAFYYGGTSIMSRFDLHSPEARRDQKLSDDVISCVNSNFDKVIFGFASGSTELWNSSRAIYKSRSKHDLPVSAVCWVGETIITVSSDYTVRIHSENSQNSCWGYAGLLVLTISIASICIIGL
jgi:WD40 repeat protein